MKLITLILLLSFCASLPAQSFKFKKKNNKYIFKNSNGKLELDKQFDEAISDKEGMWIVRNETKWGVLSYRGKLIAELKYDTIYAFKNGVSIIRLEDKYGAIDKEGEILLDFIFDKIDYCREEESLVRKEGTWGFFKNGKFTETKEKFILSNPEQEAILPQCIGQPQECNDKAMGYAMYKNIKYPPMAREKGIQGTVIAEVIIDENGQLTSCQIVESVHYVLDVESERVITENLQKWVPAIDGGNPVASKKRIPIRFRLE